MSETQSPAEGRSRSTRVLLLFRKGLFAIGTGLAQISRSIAEDRRARAEERGERERAHSKKTAINVP
jgi:hypothetical protein